MPLVTRRNLTVMGIDYRIGDVIPEGAISPIKVESMLSRGRLERVDNEPAASPAVEPVAPTPTDTATRKRGRPPGSKNKAKK